MNVRILELAERREWGARQRLYVAGVLVLDALRRLARGRRRAYYYHAEAAAYRARIEDIQARAKLSPRVGAIVPWILVGNTVWRIKRRPV